MKPRRCIGFARRRIGRGGRVILDRVSTDYDDYWRTLDYTIYESSNDRIKEKLCKDDEVFRNSTTDIFNNLGLGNNSLGQPIAIDSNVSLKTKDIKLELVDDGITMDSSVSRTSFSSVRSGDGSTDCVIKQEPPDMCPDQSVPIMNNEVESEDLNDMVETLRAVQRDWSVLNNIYMAVIYWV